MAITTTHKQVMSSGEINETSFGVGDVIRVHQRIFDRAVDKKGDATDEIKSRVQIFEGTVIAIRGRDMGKSVIVRRIGAQSIGMEMIFPLNAPTIEKIEVSRTGVKGSHHAKLYFIRNKPKRDIEKIYSRTHKKDLAPVTKVKKSSAKKSKKAKA